MPRKKSASKQTLLFPKKRICIHCGEAAAIHVRYHKPSDPTILSVSMVVYYKPRGTDPQHCATRSLDICDKCTARAVAGSPKAPRAESITLLNAIRERLGATYNAMLEANQQ